LIDTAHPRRLPWRRASQTDSPRKDRPRRLLLLALLIALPLIGVQVASYDAAPVAIAGGDEDDDDDDSGPGDDQDDDDQDDEDDNEDDDDSGPDDHDRNPTLRDRVIDVRQELDSLSDEIEDLGEPVEEFEIFDQCMYQLGVTEYGRRADGIGYVYGRRRHREAFAIDIRGLDTSRYRFLAFPGEEPPSIECNEDAGGLFTN
jgi:hypothetical protein